MSTTRLLLFLILCAPFADGFAALRIFYTDITSGPNSGGEGDNGAYLSIFGTGFGVKGSVTVGGGVVARYISWSDEKVSVQIGGNARTGDIVLTAAGGGSAIAPDKFTVRSGNFYFIGPNGSDSGGSVNNVDRPFRTPNYVKERIKPGDFIIVRGGEYDLSDEKNNLVSRTFLRATGSGTQASPLTFMAHPGESVVIHQNAPNLELFSNYQTIAHWVVAGFKVSLNHCISGNGVVELGPVRLADSSCTGNIPGHASYVRIVNLDIDGHGVGGMCNGTNGYADGPVIINYADHVKILGISIHNTGPQAGMNQRGHLIYLGATQNDVEVGWNRVYRIPHSRAIIQVATDNVGGNCYGHKRLTDIKIHDNVVHDVAGQAILLGGGAGDVEVYNNLIYNTPMPDDHRYEDVISLRGDGGRLNANIHDNIVYANPNHVAAGWLLGMGSVVGDGCPESLIFKNNIFYVTDPQDTYMRQTRACANNKYITSTNNIWYGAKSGLPGFHGAGDISSDPMFVSPQKGDFRIQSSSKAAKSSRDNGAAKKTDRKKP